MKKHPQAKNTCPTCGNRRALRKDYEDAPADFPASGCYTCPCPNLDTPLNDRYRAGVAAVKAAMPFHEGCFSEVVENEQIDDTIVDLLHLLFHRTGEWRTEEELKDLIDRAYQEWRDSD